MKTAATALMVIAVSSLSACSRPAPAPASASSSAAPVPASAAAVEPADPKAFLAALYAHYNGSDMNFSPFDQPQSWFDPKLLALMDANDKATPDGEVGALDGDPVCDCQDYQKLHADITVTATVGDTAEAKVRLRDTGETKAKVLTFDLERNGGKWRIHDIRTSDMPSLRRLLINSSPKA